MFCGKTVSALSWASTDAHLKRLLSSRRLRSSVTSSTRSGQAGGGGHSASPRPQAAGQHGGAEGHGQTTSADSPFSVDFELTREAYRSKDSLELLRSLVVFKLCSYDFLVDKNVEIMDLGKKILGQKVFEQVMKMTFYGQFVAGEDQRAIKPLIQKNQAFGVGSVLDYSVEEDISQKKTEQKEISSRVSAAGNESIGGDHREEEAHELFDDSQGGVRRAPSYRHADEIKCDQHMETFIKCIKASGGSSTEGFSAIKMTALGRPQLLLGFSEILMKWQRCFTFLASQQGKDGLETLEQRLDLTQLQECLTKLGAKGDFYGWFTGKKAEFSGYIDMLDWNSLLDDRAKISNLLVVPNVELGELEPLMLRFTIDEEKQMQRILQRLDILAKEAYDSVTMDVELSKREGWHFAAKLVRGAYMYQERERAREIGYEDPINPDYESTNRMYHRCLDYVLDEIALNREANVMVASHNEDTVKHTLRRMNELGLLPAENKVYFGQLLGMCDQISFPLGQAGFPVYKYVPYGPVSEVMPYLSRRAQENRGFMKGAQKERDLLWNELKRRLASGELLYRPAY
ncbi:proline dehydrogenase 1, mitochondrial isoform X2 [Leuresthes tenuis]|uniref:proline dehydrogenase 1, mitochondrial isoform X2 n=1 Tax=Leuresthes tenuis TaxID=355514 RepID=UPI003B5024D9